MTTKCFDNVTMLRFGKTKVSKEELMVQKTIKIWDIDVDNIVDIYHKIIWNED